MTPQGGVSASNRTNKQRFYYSDDPMLWNPYTGEIEDNTPYTPERELRRNRVTVKEFAASHPHGRWIISTDGHMMAVVDGDVIDTFDSRRRKVQHAWSADTAQTRH